MKTDETFSTGTVVEYVHDPSVRGVVVGHGAVDNGADPSADGNRTFAVVIVSLSKLVANGGGWVTHQAFMPSVLRVADGAAQ